jgi:hypothetical protein
MTATIGQGDRAQARPAPTPTGVVPALPRRRRMGLLALGIVLVVVGAVVGYLVVATTGVTRPYLAMSHDVPYGGVITADDLTVVNINPAAGLSVVPAADSRQVIGLHATTDLHAGTLLSRSEVAAVTVPAPGQQVLALDLEPGQLPGSITVGGAVLLAIVPDSTSGVPDPNATGNASTTTIQATVVAGPVTESDGNVRVDVAVDATDAPTVAAMSAAGRIVLIVTTRS